MYICQSDILASDKKSLNNKVVERQKGIVHGGIKVQGRGAVQRMVSILVFPHQNPFWVQCAIVFSRGMIVIVYLDVWWII